MSKPPIHKWFKSSRSETGQQCVEIYLGDEVVGVRDTKDHGHGPELWFPGEIWDDFIASGIWKH